ncbi:MAG: tRNA (N(6)-L-threonylcarbamoyladenosine(37)-C(2))-methylthiotransferase MtaB [Chloroflexota bacterium]
MRKVDVAISVAMESLGCKLNQAEVAAWARELERAGYRVVDASEKADIYVLNTCTVTHVADRKSRHLLRMARRRNPDALIVAAGCYAERAPDEMAKIPGLGLIVGNGQKARLTDLIVARRNGDETCSPKLAGTRALRTRALVKIQDGCDEFCTYCIVPLVRGRQRSRPLVEIVSDVKERVMEGYREVVLTGTQIGAYGRDLGDQEDLCTLVRSILGQTALPRLRLSSVHPQDVSEDFLSLWRDGRLCRHLHVSVQSGSDSVLARMGRRYATADFGRAVASARERVPDLSVTTDVIVGFPGESEAEFEESYNFCQRMAFARMHVFAYSPRPGTAAADMAAPVDELTKKQRSRKMQALAKKAALRFHEQWLGREQTVLWQTFNDCSGPEKVWCGLTSNYLKVYARSSANLGNRLLEAGLTRTYRDGVWGELALLPGRS